MRIAERGIPNTEYGIRNTRNTEGGLRNTDFGIKGIGSAALRGAKRIANSRYWESGDVAGSCNLCYLLFKKVFVVFATFCEKPFVFRWVLPPQYPPFVTFASFCLACPPGRAALKHHASRP